MGTAGDRTAWGVGDGLGQGARQGHWGTYCWGIVGDSLGTWGTPWDSGEQHRVMGTAGSSLRHRVQLGTRGAAGEGVGYSLETLRSSPGLRPGDPGDWLGDTEEQPRDPGDTRASLGDPGAHPGDPGARSGDTGDTSWGHHSTSQGPWGHQGTSQGYWVTSQGYWVTSWRP